MPSKHLLFHNGLIFTAPAAELSAASLQPALHRYSDASAAASSSSSLPGRFAEALLVRDEAILAVGTLDECRAAAAGNDIRHTDLQGKLLLPSFIDGHTHVTLFGQSMQKLDLAPCTDLASIQAKLLAYRNANPNLDRILAKGWLQKTTHNVALSSMIDDVVSDIPVYIESKDLHSHWLNQSALAELGIRHDTPNPPGGTIQRDPTTRAANGLMSELANINIVWPALASLRSDAETESDFQLAVDAYLASGYTGVVEMALDESALACFLRAVMKQVERAIELFHLHGGKEAGRDVGDLRVVGIKIMCDGVIDACTAALKEPYADGSRAGPIWTYEMLHPVLHRADSEGLQLALHAIGDEAVHIAVEAIASLPNEASNPIASRRHRIEHLELTDPVDIEKLGRLGITASVQPVHSDPAILSGWYAQLSSRPHEHDERCSRAFAYRHFIECGAPLAIGSDTPTASHLIFPNLYNAVTRRSTRPLERGQGLRTTPEQAIPLATALAAATYGAARSCKAEDATGSLERGKSADFVVVDSDLFASYGDDGGEGLMKAKILQTWFRGRVVFELPN
ncbi:related to amidohydrolase family protein [Pseudozyma flocculosa]|uniref:Related to amidohydrolase family protein n=1 Tax=Pseudozyma flocculosa TaxID=84751 RepID=A0A5C3EXR9_9BASI|nr:related to amidohydrolase family protein [Pseudozyma flocculosa]